MEKEDLMVALGRAVATAARSHGVEKPDFVLVLLDQEKTHLYVSNCNGRDRRKLAALLRAAAGRIERGANP